MKYFSKIFLSFLLLIFSLSWVFASSYISVGNGRPDIPYCQNGDCGIKEWIDAVRAGVDDLETDRSASEYVQSIIIYLLGFISLIAVIYIIYSGFQILIWNGDEEKLKKSKQTIIYVIIGIIVIWISWPLTLFIFRMLG